MKKIVISIAILAALSNQAFAKNGFYIGADIAHNTVEQKFHNRDFYSAAFLPNNMFVRDSGTGFGLNAGYKQELCDKLFIAPEIFYDKLNVDAGDYYYNHPNPSFTSPNDQIQFKYRYGVKLNLGYNFTQKFTGFVNVGVAQLKYKTDYPSVATTTPFNEEKSKNSPILGVGVLYNITNNVAAKFEYNRQNFNIDYGIGSSTRGAVARSRVNIDSLKVGLVYNF